MSGKPSVVVASAMGVTLRRPAVVAGSRLGGAGHLRGAGRLAGRPARLPARAGLAGRLGAGAARRLRGGGPTPGGCLQGVLCAGCDRPDTEVAAGDPDAQQLADPDIVLVHDDASVSVLDHGIPTLQGRLGGEGDDLTAQVL